MPASFVAGAVVYAKDVVRLSRFYAELANLPIVEEEPRFVVLESPSFQLVVVAPAPAIAARIEIATPPLRREDTAIKLCLAVPDLAAARVTAERLGGQLNPQKKEWSFRGGVVCDGHDPEGNVFQLRAPAG